MKRDLRVVWLTYYRFVEFCTGYHLNVKIAPFIHLVSYLKLVLMDWHTNI